MANIINKIPINTLFTRDMKAYAAENGISETATPYIASSFAIFSPDS